MKVTPHAVRRQLEQLGYSDVPEEVVMEFLAELQAEADSEAAAEPEQVRRAPALPACASPTWQLVHPLLGFWQQTEKINFASEPFFVALQEPDFEVGLSYPTAQEEEKPAQRRPSSAKATTRSRAALPPRPASRGGLRDTGAPNVHPQVPLPDSDLRQQLDWQLLLWKSQMGKATRVLAHEAEDMYGFDYPDQDMDVVSAPYPCRGSLLSPGRSDVWVR